MSKIRSGPARRLVRQSLGVGGSLGEGGEETKEQLEEDLRKAREEVAVQKWGIEKS